MVKAFPILLSPRFGDKPCACDCTCPLCGTESLWTNGAQQPESGGQGAYGINFESRKLENCMAFILSLYIKLSCILI